MRHQSCGHYQRAQQENVPGAESTKLQCVGRNQTGQATADADDKESEEFWESMICEPCEMEDDEVIGRPVKLPRNFRKPTKQEVLEHLPSHWPFRSWCKHCLAGRAVGAHHKARTDEEREFARSGVPTISLDHCFLGSEGDEDSAHSSPYLVLYDSASEALYAVAVKDKTAQLWVVEYVTRVINELGYGSTRIALKIDRALELQDLRKLVAARRAAPTVPLDVPVRESKANGAVENAVRRWQGQFRTIKSHVEAELNGELPRDHPVLQWMAVWAAGVINRVPIRSHGRTVYEFVTGHRMKVPMAIFGESVVWRQKRHSAALNKYDSEWSDGIYLGIAGLSTEALIGTEKGRCENKRLSTIARWEMEPGSRAEHSDVLPGVC